MKLAASKITQKDAKILASRVKPDQKKMTNNIIDVLMQFTYF